MAKAHGGRAFRTKKKRRGEGGGELRYCDNKRLILR